MMSSFRLATVLLAHSLTGVASIVLDDGRLVPVYLRELSPDTFEFVSEVNIQDGQKALLRGVRQEVIVGEPINLCECMIVRRTTRPFMSLHEHYAPHDEDLTIKSVAGGRVWYNDEQFKLRSFDARYATTGYFTVLSS